MAFDREPGSALAPTPAELTARMVGIGMKFAAAAEANAEIESTLVHASALGMEEGDLRVLAVLTTWLGVHHSYINADRLVRLVSAHPSERVCGYWAAIATWLKKDRRLVRLAAAYRGATLDLLPTGTAFQLARRGQDQRFAKTPLRVPKDTLRDRPEDVLPPELLVRRHAGYRNRVLMGPSFRADVWTVLELGPDLSIAEVARRAYCSFATAWQATRDYRLLRAAGEAAMPLPRAGYAAARTSTARKAERGARTKAAAAAGSR